MKSLTTSLNNLDDAQLQQLYNAPISVSDACSMLRRKIGRNEPPYTQTIVKLNNQLVDEWEQTVLRKTCNSKCQVIATKVERSWAIFHEGKVMPSARKIMELVPRPTKEQLQFWLDFFEKSSIEDLHKLGAGAVSCGWQLVLGELKFWYIEQKYEQIYSKSDDPLEWEKIAIKHGQLFEGKLFPFWNEELFKEICEKIQAILSITIEPTN
jgi:hypothetical protein